MGVFFYQSDSAWRYSVFIIQDEKGLIFITVHEGQEKKLYYKAFKKTQAVSSTEHILIFLKGERFPPGSDGECIEQPLGNNIPTKCNGIEKNQTPSPHDVWCGH